MAKGTVYQRKKMNTSDGSVKYYYVKVVNDKSVRISKETFDLATKRRSKKGGDPMAPVTVDVTNYKSGMFYGKSGWEILRDNHKDKPLIELLNANGITQNTFTPENIEPEDVQATLLHLTAISALQALASYAPKTPKAQLKSPRKSFLHKTLRLLKMQ